MTSQFIGNPGRIDSRKKKSQKGQAVSVFHSREPDVRQDLEEVQYDLDKPRIAVILGEFTKYSMLVQFETCSEK